MQLKYSIGPAWFSMRAPIASGSRETSATQNRLTLIETHPKSRSRELCKMEPRILWMYICTLLLFHWAVRKSESIGVEEECRNKLTKFDTHMSAYVGKV